MPRRSNESWALRMQMPSVRASFRHGMTTVNSGAARSSSCAGGTRGAATSGRVDCADICKIVLSRKRDPGNREPIFQIVNKRKLRALELLGSLRRRDHRDRLGLGRKALD